MSLSKPVPSAAGSSSALSPELSAAKPYSCAHCGKRFTDPKGPGIHMGINARCLQAQKALVRVGLPKAAKLSDPEVSKFQSMRRSVVADSLFTLRVDDNLGDRQVERVKGHIKQMLDVCKPELVRRLRPHSKQAADVPMRRIVDEVLDVFQGLETCKKEFAYLCSRVPYLEPVEHIFGKVLSHTSDAEGFTYSKKLVTHRAFYMPMSQVIERLLQQDPRALEMVLRTQKTWFEKRPPKGASETIYMDITDGQVFRDHPQLGDIQRGKPLGGRIRLGIIMYYDGLEVTSGPPPPRARTPALMLMCVNCLQVANPLGFARGKHQLGVFMFALVNLEATVRTTPGYIQIAGIVLESDVKKFGPLVTFAGVNPVTREPDPDLWATPGAQLRALDEGVLMNVPGGASPTPTHGWLVLFIADMLAMHKLNPFVESPSAYCPCRACNFDTRKVGAYTPVRFRGDGSSCGWHLYRAADIEKELAHMRMRGKSASQERMQDFGFNSLDHALSPDYCPWFDFIRGSPQVRAPRPAPRPALRRSSLAGVMFSARAGVHRRRCMSRTMVCSVLRCTSFSTSCSGSGATF